MQDPLDIFNSKIPLKRIFISPGARKMRSLNAPAMLEISSACSTSSTCTGTDYVDEHLKREQQLLEASSSMYRTVRGVDGNNFDQISVTTAATSNVVFDENQEKIYNTYDVEYTPSKELTILSVRDKIVNMVAINPVTIIQGPTGCGKTTQVPQYILDDCAKRRVACNIIVTQPRRIAAMSIAKRVSQERNWPLGSLVGFRVGLINNTSQDTRLTYCTTGVLLQRLVRDKHMNDYTHIIIDEIHERDQDMDFLLLIVRKFLRTNSRGVRVILMSATFNVKKFADYFSFYVGKQLIPAPSVDITKTNQFTIHEFYLDDIPSLGDRPTVSGDEPGISKPMMELSLSLMKILDRVDDEPGRDNEKISRPAVLVFLPGIHEIEEIYNLMDTPNNNVNKWDILVLHSSITHEEQEKIFTPPPNDHRRIILSTNIAESSLTVPNVKYVIDFCLTKQQIIDPATNFHSLELTWASKANCAQRAGRTGRVMDGRVYRLVSKSFYEQVINEENPPEIMRAPLENVYLKAKLLNLDKPVALLALSLDPPNLTNVHKTVLILKESGALLDDPDDPLDGELTDLGRVMGHLPLEIHITKLIMLGQVFSVLREAVIIGASMATKNMFSAPFREKLPAYKAKLLWARKTNSDGIAFLHAYRAWMNFRAQRGTQGRMSESTWVRKSFIQLRVIREIEATVGEITERLDSLGIRETRSPERIIWTPDELQFVLKVVIAGAFYPQYYMAIPRADERQCVKELGGLDPAKTVYLTGWPVKQPGMLYAKRIQGLFKDVLTSDSSRVAVKFDYSNRIYVQFNKTEVKDPDTPEIPGEIPASVYQAIKLRQIGEIFTIPILDPDVANDRAEEFGLECQVKNLFLGNNKPPILHDKTKQIRPKLPALNITNIPINIMRMIDPGHFWVQLRNEETASNLRLIRKAIDKAGSLEELNDLPKVNSLLLASKDNSGRIGSYERVVIQSISLVAKDKYEAQVLFIDYGRIGKRSTTELRKLPKNSILETIPSAAFQCILAHIKPAIINVLADEWTDASKLAFKKITKDNKLTGEIYSIVNSIVHITLYAENDKNHKININNYLIDNGFASKKDEDYLSKYNHEHRIEYKNLSEDEIIIHEEGQYSQIYHSDNYIEPPNDNECNNLIRLQGPYSPLEVKITTISCGNSGCKLQIDPLSVNSVLLDASLNNPQERLIIAGFVSQGFNSGNLTLRNTTLMHNIPGLACLLTLIFSPKIELRANCLKTRYIGALCGLGYDGKSIKKESIFPEHDINIGFDVNISIDDLQQINKLRYWMSLGIFVRDEEENGEVCAEEVENDTLRCQLKVKELLFSLMSKKREIIPKEPDYRSMKWGRYPDTEFMKPDQVDNYKKIIYKLHHALLLHPRDDAHEEMIRHLKELSRIAALHPKTSGYEEMECNLCGQKLLGILHLRNHITSAYHLNRENDILSGDNQLDDL